jgi:hypothetical protein
MNVETSICTWRLASAANRFSAIRAAVALL